MTPEARRSEKFEAAVTHLDWCAAVPHTIDQIIGIYAEKTSMDQRPMRHGLSNEDIIASITGGQGGGGKGGHADPTPQAALYGEPDAVDDDGTLREIRGTITTILEAACELDDLCTMSTDEPLWRPPATDPTMTGQIRDAVSRLHHCRPLLDITAGVHPHADWLLSSPVGDSASWLHGKARGIWEQHRGDQLPVAEQKPIAECKVCSPWRRNTIAGTSGLCDQCKDFRYHHKCLPTEPIVRRWEATGSNQTPPGMIIEAQAASRRKVKAS